jgi:hypothetical protein
MKLSICLRTITLARVGVLLFITPTEWQGFQLNTSPFLLNAMGRLCITSKKTFSNLTENY